MEVKRRRGMTQCIEVDPFGRFVANVSGHTVVIGAMALVDAVDLLAQDSLAVFYGDTGGRAVIHLNRIDARCVAAVDPRTVVALYVGGDHPVKAVIGRDMLVPKRAARIGLSLISDRVGGFARVNEDKEREFGCFIKNTLRERIIVEGRNDILNVGHFPHQIEIAAVICRIKRI